MKLELIKVYEPDNIQFLIGGATLNAETAIFLVIDKTNKYSLISVSTDEVRSTNLNYIESFTKTDNYPVLYTKDGSFGIIKNTLST